MRALILAALLVTVGGCEILAPVVGTVPDRRTVDGRGCDPDVRCERLAAAPPETFDAEQLEPVSAFCPGGWTHQAMTVSESVAIDTRTLSCVDLEVTVVPGRTGELLSPTLTLRGDVMDSAIVRVTSHEVLASIALTTRFVSGSELHLDGAIRLTASGASFTNVTFDLGGDEPIDPPEATFTSGTLSEVHIVGPRAPVRFRDAHVGHTVIEARSIALERGSIDRSFLHAELIEVLDTMVSASRFDSDRLIVTGGLVSASYVARCGSVTLAATEVIHSRFARCLEPIEAQRASLGDDVLAGSIVGAHSNLDTTVIGGERLDIDLGMLSNVALCGTTILHASSINCGRCEPGAPSDVCLTSFTSVSACPGLCHATCSAGRPPAAVDPLYCAE